MAAPEPSPELRSRLLEAVDKVIEDLLKEVQALEEDKKAIDLKMASKNQEIKEAKAYKATMFTAPKRQSTLPLETANSIPIDNEALDKHYIKGLHPYQNANNICLALDAWVSSSRILDIVMEREGFAADQREGLMKTLSAMLAQRRTRKAPGRLVSRNLPKDKSNYWGLPEWLEQPEKERKFIK